MRWDRVSGVQIEAVLSPWALALPVPLLNIKRVLKHSVVVSWGLT